MAWPAVKFFWSRSATGIDAVGDLDDSPRAGVQERPQLERRDRALVEGDAPFADGDLEVGQRGPAFLVRLERPQLGAGGHDPVAQPGEHRPRRHRAVGGAQRSAVELGDRRHPRVAGREEPGRPAGTAGAGLGPGLDEGDQLEDGVVGKRLQGDRVLVRHRGEAEDGQLVAAVGGQLEGGLGARQEARRRRGGDGGNAQRSTEADDRGEDEAGDEGEDGHVRARTR